MKIAVIGGTGLIGSQVVENLNKGGHEAVPHSQSTGVDIITGEGLERAVDGAQVIVNVTNSPTFDKDSISFFQTSMGNLLTASSKGGAGHFVVLSIVGIDQVPDVDYLRAKVQQEDILKAGPLPYSIVRATQFMESMDSTLAMNTQDDVIRLPSTPIQPIAAMDVSSTVAEVATGLPRNDTVNIAGPDVYQLDELGRLTLSVKFDKRHVITDESASMWATAPGDSLTAPGNASIAQTHYADWLNA